MDKNNSNIKPSQRYYQVLALLDNALRNVEVSIRHARKECDFALRELTRPLDTFEKNEKEALENGKLKSL